MADGDEVGQFFVDSTKSREKERWGGLSEHDAWGALESASNGEQEASFKRTKGPVERTRGTNE
jgi:hypothetical protein